MTLTIAHTQEVTIFFIPLVIFLYVVCLLLKHWISNYFFKYSLHPIYSFLSDGIGLLGYIFLSDYLYNLQIIENSELTIFFVPFFPFIISHFIILYLLSFKKERTSLIKKSIIIGIITPTIFAICSDAMNEIIK